MTDRYQALFEQSADAILIIDGDRFIECNEATVRMLRYSTREELLQTHPSELSPEFQPDGRRSYEKANEMIEYAFERGSHRFEWHHRRADGEVFPVEVLLTAVPEGNRFILHVVWRDITSRKRLEADLQHAQKMEAIGKLAGGIAHDFNNLLVAIMGYADLLTIELKGAEPLSEYARVITHSARRAAELTSQLLAFSRKQALAPEVINVNDTLDSLAGMMQRLIGEDIALDIETTSDTTTVKTDPSQFEQVVLNILANARDAMPGGGKVTMRTTLLSATSAAARGLEAVAHICLSIKDTGEGMRPEIVAQAFEPFFTDKELGHGTGLGLASVYGSVKQSGGDVRITSEVGKGTTVDVFLPHTTEQEHPQPIVRRREHRPEGVDAKILLVEDDPVVRAVVRQALESRGYTIIEAQNGAEALRVFSGSPVQIDFVLTDVVMPTMSGPEMVNHLRKHRRGLPAIFMSGYTDDILAKHGFDLEEIKLIRKPFTGEELVEYIEQFLESISSP